jgi:hypothetical protein
MNTDGFLTQKADLKERIVLLEAANTGKLDNLHCPNCHANAVSVWFTRRTDNDYWTWFFCDRCDFEMRAQGSRPPHYSENRERSVRASTKKQGTAMT